MPSGRKAWVILPDTEQVIRRFLSEGYPLKHVADIVDVQYPTVLAFAKKNCLPYNRPINPGSIKEARVCRYVVAGWSIPEIARVFRVAPVMIEEALNRVKSRSCFAEG